MRPKAYTIAELIVVITIILILASAAIGGTSGIIRSLRFSNTFNKMVLMVQQARSNAITGKGDITTYGIEITDDKNFKMTASSVPTEPLQLQDSTGLTFSFNNAESLPVTSCTLPAKIEFKKMKTESETKTTLTCNTDSAIKQLQIGLCSDATNCKTFLINKAAGIPQVQ